MKIVSIYDFFQKFPDEEAARLYLEKKKQKTAACSFQECMDRA